MATACLLDKYVLVLLIFQDALLHYLNCYSVLSLPLLSLDGTIPNKERTAAASTLVGCGHLNIKENYKVGNTLNFPNYQ